MSIGRERKEVWGNAGRYKKNMERRLANKIEESTSLEDIEIERKIERLRDR